MRWLAGSVVVALLLTGCLGGGASPKSGLDDPAAGGSGGPAAEVLGGAAANATELAAENLTLDDWFTASVNATAEGAVAGFWWTLPPGAVVAQKVSTAGVGNLCGAAPNLCGSSRRLVALESSPHVTAGPPEALEAWQLIVFRERGGELFMVPHTMGGEFATSETYLGAIGTREEVRPVLEPRLDRLFPQAYGHDEPWSEGERLGLVLAARSPEPVTFTLAFRAAPEDPGCCGSSAGQPAADHDAFVAERGGREPLPLVAHGVGVGYHVAGYDDWGYAGQWSRWATPDMVVEETVPLGPGPRAQSITLRSEAPFERGWSVLWAYAGGTATGGTARFAVDLHGTTLVQDETFAMLWYTGEYPDVTVIAEGEGAAAVSYAVQMADPTGWDYLGMWHLAVGATLQGLLGAPFPAYQEDWDMV